MKQADFFLGALSPKGFNGYFSQLAQVPGMQMFLLQSGPGCGKSTFMRRIAEAAPWDRVLIHCSSDPDSLDGVIFPAQKIALVDATAPHILNPKAPGASERVISLYHTLNNEVLQQNQAKVFALLRRYSCQQDRAARCLAAAAALLTDRRRAAACCTDFDRVCALAGQLSRRYLPKLSTPGSEWIYLLSAVTPKGILPLRDSVRTLAGKQIVVLQDEYGAVSRLVLEKLREEALRKGHRVISCPCPLSPEEKLDHLLLPDLGLAFVTDNSWHPMEFPGARRIRCRRFADRALLAACRVRLGFDKRAARSLLEETSAAQRDAAQIHSELEACYHPCVDFAEVEKVWQRTAAQLGLCRESAKPGPAAP